MTPKQLHYFAQIAECGSFSAASKRINIAQSALSLQMTKFEAELGVSLFFRKPRGIELTEAGERLLQHAYSIQRHIEAALLDIQADELEPTGVVRVGMIPAINNALAARLLNRTQEYYPKVQLDIVGGPSKHLTRQIEARHLDIAIVHSDSDGFGELTVTPVFKETLFFIGSIHKKYPHTDINKHGESVIKFSDIAHYQTISTEVQDGLGFRIRQYEEKLGVELNKRPSLGQLSSDLNEIINGIAEMILPWSAVYHLMGNKIITAAKIVEPAIERDIFLLTNPKNQLTNRLLKTQALIKALLPDLFNEGVCIGELIHANN